MDKFRIVYSIIIKVWKAMSLHKDSKVTQDDECKKLLDELQVICDEIEEQFGEKESKLAKDISGLFLEYLCRKED